MAIDYTSMIQQRLPGLVSRGSLPIEQQSFARNERFARLLEMLRGPEPEVPDPTSQVVAAESGALSGAEPEEESGFNIFNSLFSVLDAFGRPIRGLLGAGTAAAKGDFDKAGSRLKDAALAPIDSLTFNIFDVAKEEDNTTGSDILNDLGWKSGTTTEDERRIRIAMAAGLSRRDAMRQFGVHGDRRLPQEVAQSFENVIQEARKRNPEIELNATMDDFKNAVDAQDFAGFAVEILTDPLTYMSMGATAVGKAARTVGTFAKHAPEMVQAIRGAAKLEDALKAIRGASKVTSKQKKRLEKLVTRAWKQVPEGERPSLYMADNWAKQVREGQRAMFVTLGGRPIVKGGPVAEVLSHIGQTKTAEEILGKATPTGVAGKIVELPGVKQVVGGVKGLVRFTRDKMDTKTGVPFIDELMLARDADSREGLTQIGRTLNALEEEVRVAARTKSPTKALDEGVTEINEVFHGTVKDFDEIKVDADRVAVKDKPGRGKVRGAFFTPDENVAINYLVATFPDVARQASKDDIADLMSASQLARDFEHTKLTPEQWAKRIADFTYKKKTGTLEKLWGLITGKKPLTDNFFTLYGLSRADLGRDGIRHLGARGVTVLSEATGKRAIEFTKDGQDELIKFLTAAAKSGDLDKISLLPHRPGVRPRTVRTALRGKMVDLTDPHRWSDTLVKQLEDAAEKFVREADAQGRSATEHLKAYMKGKVTSDYGDDYRVLQRLRKAQDAGGWLGMDTIERSPALQKWLKENGFDLVKKPENDDLTGDFSYWVLNQKAIVDADKLKSAKAPSLLPETSAKALAREKQLKQQIAKTIEISKQTGGDMVEAAEAARVSLGISNSVMEADAVAKVAAGIVRINETVLNKASKVPTRIRELNDDTIQYLHRMLTPEARKYFKEQGKRSKFAADTGLEFNARSRTFKMRSDSSRGRTLDEINAEFRSKNGFDLFNPDPIASTRESVRLTQRAIANAKFGEAFVREYGQTTTQELDTLLEALDNIPERLLNMRKGAELDAATTKAAARAARELGQAHGGRVELPKQLVGKKGEAGIIDFISDRTPKAKAFVATMKPNKRGQVEELKKILREEIRNDRPRVSVALAETRAKGVIDPEKVPEGLDVMGTAAYFKQVLKDAGITREGEVSAFDIYNRLGLKLPDNPEDLAKLVSVTVPEEAAAFVTRALKLQEEPHVFFQYYDRYTQWAKATVTVLFPAFHGRNMLENTFKNFIEGNTNLNNYRNATKLLAQAADLAAGSPDWVGRVANKIKRAFQKAGDPDKAVLNELAEAGVGRTYAEIADWLVAHGILDNRITSEFGEVLQEGIEGATTLGHRARGLGGRIATELGTQGGAVRGGFALSAGTENLHRVSLFLDRIGKGYNPLEAAAEVKRVFFDYRALTNLESTYLKRMGFFYSFYRNNLRYIMQQFFTRPELTKQTLRLFTNDPDNPKQRWLSDKASFTAGAKEVALGFIPQGQFNMFGFEGEDVVDKLSGKAGDILGMGNPAIAMPLEVAFNKDLFTGGPLFGEATSVDWSFAPQEVQDFIGYHQTEDGRHKVGRLWNLITGVAPVIGRFSSTAIQLTSKERVYWEKLTRVFTGLNIQDRDLEKEDLALIDRNLMRASKGMDLVKRDVRGNYRVNTETAQGRVASALLFPSKEKITDLGLAPEVLFTLKPYMTFDKEGKVRLTDALRLKMHEVATQMFPQERAFFDAVEGRKAVVKSVQGRDEDELGGQAMEAFNEFLSGTR